MFSFFFKKKKKQSPSHSQSTSTIKSPNQSSSIKTKAVPLYQQPLPNSLGMKPQPYSDPVAQKLELENDVNFSMNSSFF